MGQANQNFGHRYIATRMNDRGDWLVQSPTGTVVQWFLLEDQFTDGNVSREDSARMGAVGCAKRLNNFAPSDGF